MEPEIPIKQFVKLLQEYDPDLWNRCYPRMYKHTDQYGSPKVAAAAIASSLWFVERGVRSPISLNVCMGAQMLWEYDTPHLFVSKDLLNAVALTEPPTDLRWDSISLPYDAAILMLPKNWLKRPAGGYCDFIAYARIRPGTLLELAGEPIITSKDTFMVFTMGNEPPKMIMQLTINSEDTPYVSTKELSIPTIESISVFDAPLTADEDEFIANCMGLTFRLLLALESRPALLSTGQRVGISHKKSRGSIELWTPNIIGLNYRYQKKEGKGEDSGQKRMHWRRGHYTRQVHGRGRALRKTIWIEPVLVGG